jgi:cysteine desulfurase/selenocysteine lyase
LAEAVRCLDSLGRDAIERHEATVTAHALKRLGEVPGLKLIGPRVPEHRIPVFSFTMASASPQEILRKLDAQGIAIRAGDLSALPLLKRSGVKAAARASCYLYTTVAEVDQFVDALLRISIDQKK